MLFRCWFMMIVWQRALDEGLTPLVPALLQHHVQDCERCRNRVLDDLAIRALLRASRPGAPPARSVAEAVMSRLA